MKVEIEASGTLRIKAETDLEAYALGQWGAQNLVDSKGSNMVIEVGLIAPLTSEKNIFYCRNSNCPKWADPVNHNLCANCGGVNESQFLDLSHQGSEPQMVPVKKDKVYYCDSAGCGAFGLQAKYEVCTICLTNNLEIKTS